MIRQFRYNFLLPKNLLADRAPDEAATMTPSVHRYKSGPYRHMREDSGVRSFKGPVAVQDLILDLRGMILTTLQEILKRTAWSHLILGLMERSHLSTAPNFSNKTTENSMLRWMEYFVFVLPISLAFPQQGNAIHAGRTTRSQSHCYSCY